MSLNNDSSAEWAYFTDLGPWIIGGKGEVAADGTRRALCNAEQEKDLSQLTIVRSHKDVMRAHLVMCPHVSNRVLRDVCGMDVEGSQREDGESCSSESDGSVDQEVVGSPGTSISNQQDDRKADVLEVTAVDDGNLVSPLVVTFMAPRVIALTPLKLMSTVNLPPGKVLVRTEMTAVSAGTEMLVYRGRMPSDIPTDAILTGSSGDQASSAFSYPATYGYANVGVVVAVGGVPSGGCATGKRKRRSAETNLMPGTRVFAFREHTSWYMEDMDSVMRVPDGVDAADAVFLPNVETAVSLAMDAHPLPGENVVVVGQGIVGLLLVTVLKLCYNMTNVIAVDTLETRLKVSHSSAGADRVLRVDPAATSDATFQRSLARVLPPEDRAGADVAIDVSGTGEGLDTAIRATRDGGRVVIGSWFGSREVTLGCLGGRFHRSNISLVASQVSNIPAPLSGRWDKARRFRMAWSALRRVAPATRFPIRIMPVQQAASVYEEIDRGTHLQVVFKY